MSMRYSDFKCPPILIPGHHPLSLLARTCLVPGQEIMAWDAE
jgi:hypothetical protein